LFLTLFLSYIPFLYSFLTIATLVSMKATMTSKGQITIPVKIRRRLGLEAGQVLEFDEDAPYLKAIPVFDEEAMRAVLGRARGRLGRPVEKWLEETRGPVSLPGAKRVKK
jgi:AbrB family looped-hinge helix DNA binding protein